MSGSTRRPAVTGSGWAEVDDAGNGPVGASNIQTASGELAREMSRRVPNARDRP